MSAYNYPNTPPPPASLQRPLQFKHFYCNLLAPLQLLHTCRSQVPNGINGISSVRYGPLAVAKVKGKHRSFLKKNPSFLLPYARFVIKKSLYKSPYLWVRRYVCQRWVNKTSSPHLLLNLLRQTLILVLSVQPE